MFILCNKASLQSIILTKIEQYIIILLLESVQLKEATTKVALVYNVMYPAITGHITSYHVGKGITHYSQCHPILANVANK